MNKNLLLTVLIPTYNRGRFLDTLLKSLSGSSILNDPSKVEVVIANNRSQDNTISVIQKYENRISNLRAINYEEHVRTAEENVFRSFKECMGEYTWILGDDDLPALETLDNVLKELEKNCHDFLIFNSPVIGPNSTIPSNVTLRMLGGQHSADIVEIAIHNGYWFVLAGMSSQIMRTRYIKAFDFQPITNISLIYSHVTAYIECYHGKVTTCFNYPLVWYRLSYHDDQHWKKASKLHDVFDEYFWTLGFIRQLKYLISKNIFDKYSLFYMLDQNDYVRFRLVYHVCEKLFHQVKASRKTTDSRQKIGRAEFYEMVDFLMETSNLLREFLWDLETYYELPLIPEAKGKSALKWRFVRAAKKKQREEALKVESNLAKKLDENIKNCSSTILYGFFVRRYGNYSIYRIGTRYFCVYNGQEKYLEWQLWYVDVVECPPYFYIAQTLEGALERLRILERTSDFVDEAGSYALFMDSEWNRKPDPDADAEDERNLEEKVEELLIIANESREAAALQGKRPKSFAELSYMILRKSYLIVRDRYRAHNKVPDQLNDKLIRQMKRLPGQFQGKEKWNQRITY